MSYDDIDHACCDEASMHIHPGNKGEILLVIESGSETWECSASIVITHCPWCGERLAKEAGE